ncbi:MAG TPA: RsmE family RNA methyltransferase [Terriglobales bacterium]|nr:RsmE family RNA methyltransferase [Terriglobales bacterium]
MTRRRWIADEVSGNNASLSGTHADHLTRVLRVRKGQEFDIVANGVVRSGRVSTIGDHRVEFELGDEIPAGLALADLTLFLAIFKFDRMEWAIEKATELGVARIIPLIAQRTDAHLSSAAEKRVERWRRIAIQASEQSRRVATPEIAAPTKLRDTVTPADSLNILLSEIEEGVSLREILSERENSRELSLAIGPEGGWTQDELDFFQKGGWISVSLGPTILRAETATIAAVAIAMSYLV